MATTRFSDHLLEGDHASRPAASAVPEGALYSCTTHSLVYQSDGASWSTWATLGGTETLPVTIIDAKGDLIAGTAADTAARLAAGSNDTILMADSGQSTGLKWVGSQTPSTQAFSDAAAEGTADTYARGDHKHGMPANPGGSGDDPVADVFGAPTTAFEFDSTSTTGLTALSPTPDVMDLDTTVPDHLYIKDNASGTARCGYYASAPSMPFTAITKVSDANVRSDYHQAGLFAGQSTPGTMKVIVLSRAARYIETETGTPTGFTGSITGGVLSDLQTPIYFGIICNSSSDWDFLYSYNGRIWAYHTEAHNAGLTPGSVGVYAASNNTNGFGAAFDYLRIWNSAKAFPGTY